MSNDLIASMNSTIVSEISIDTNMSFNYHFPIMDEDHLFALMKNMSNKNNSRKLINLWNNIWRISNNMDSCNYCKGEMKAIIENYNQIIHGYLSLLVCTFGTFANILNIAVLTRKDMANAPINRILKWLAVTDMFVMVDYILYATYKYLILPEDLNYSKPWAMYLLFHMHFTQILHTISIFLTLSLAVWRYIAIRYPHLSHVYCSETRCSIAVLASFLLPPILCTPTYMVFKVEAKVIHEHSMATVVYTVDTIDQDGLLYHVNFWIHAVVIKLLPCLILTIISFWLINALYRANKRKLALRGYSSCPANCQQSEKRHTKMDKRADRTTKMLIAVLLLFLITELPQGVLGLMSGILGKCFFSWCYNLFGEIMDILALINGAINFVLYCSMSRQFRITFGQLFKPKILAKWPTNGSQTEVQSTYV